MKRSLALAMMLFFLSAGAQGPQQLVNVPINQWGGIAKGWLYLPADYSSSNKQYPVVFFYHGLGEAGTNPYALLYQGLPLLISSGMRPDNILSPVDQKQYSFIVLSVQDQYWSPSAEWLPYELAWLKQNYRIDTSRIYVTGLSAGGQKSFHTTVVNPVVSKLITAAVPMSPANIDAGDLTLINQNKIETWFFTGDNDGIFTANAVNYSEECNLQYNGSSSLNMYNGGHCCWNTFYDTAWHDAGNGLSIWQWMLTNQKENTEPLPVHSINLSAKQNNNSVVLGWEVEGEDNVAYYEAEKSSDGKSFFKIGSVPATGSSTYQYTDWTLSPKTYYRIKIVDTDGGLKYSSIINFSLGKSAVVLKAFPTPAKNSITLQHQNATAGSSISIHSTDGRIIKLIRPKISSQQTGVELTELQKGAYYIRFNDGKGMIETVMISKL